MSDKKTERRPPNLSVFNEKSKYACIWWKSVESVFSKESIESIKVLYFQSIASTASAESMEWIPPPNRKWRTNPSQQSQRAGSTNEHGEQSWGTGAANTACEQTKQMNPLKCGKQAWRMYMVTNNKNNHQNSGNSDNNIDRKRKQNPNHATQHRH